MEGQINISDINLYSNDEDIISVEKDYCESNIGGTNCYFYIYGEFPGATYLWTYTTYTSDNYYVENTDDIDFTVLAGTISYSASNYSGTYDKSYHGITVTSSTSGTTIQYSSDNSSWSTTKPTYVNAGTYTTYYKITKTGYTTATGSRTVTINKATQNISLSCSGSDGYIYIMENTKKYYCYVTVDSGSWTYNTSSLPSQVTVNYEYVPTDQKYGIVISVSDYFSSYASITINASTSANYKYTTKTYKLDTGYYY